MRLTSTSVKSMSGSRPYHNYVCSEFAERFPIPSYEEADPEYASFCAYAQLALEHLVPFDGTTPPRRLNPQRLLQANIVG